MFVLFVLLFRLKPDALLSAIKRIAFSKRGKTAETLIQNVIASGVFSKDGHAPMPVAEFVKELRTKPDHPFYDEIEKEKYIDFSSVMSNFTLRFKDPEMEKKFVICFTISFNTSLRYRQEHFISCFNSMRVFFGMYLVVGLVFVVKNTLSQTLLPLFQGIVALNCFLNLVVLHFLYRNFSFSFYLIVLIATKQDQVLFFIGCFASTS